MRRGARRQDGWTPLHRAALRGSKEVVRALVECKADVEARNKVRSGRGRILRFRMRGRSQVQDMRGGGSGRVGRVAGSPWSRVAKM